MSLLGAIALFGHIVLHGSLPLSLTLHWFRKSAVCRDPLTCGLYVEGILFRQHLFSSGGSVKWTCDINSNCTLAFVTQTKLAAVMLFFICGS